MGIGSVALAWLLNEERLLGIAGQRAQETADRSTSSPKRPIIRRKPAP